jgi:hypothetical protein
MAYADNQHVARLKRFVPLGANSQELYEERVGDEPGDEGPVRFSVPTKALKFVSDLARDKDVSLVVLTGDAGHGKTHLCRRLLEDYGYPSAEARALLRGPQGRGAPVTPLGEATGRRPMRIIKDLSEFEEEPGAAVLGELLRDPESIGVVCANEGRLRAAIVRSGDAKLRRVLETLEASIVAGQTALEPAIHVLNLNFQSVAVPDGILARLLRWMVDGRRWAACRTCDARERCPIARNQQDLGGKEVDDGLTLGRRQAIEQLVRVMEQTGAVVTIRDTLAFCAYLITGNMDCSEVEKLDRKRQLQAYDGSYLDLLFTRKLPEAQGGQLPLVARIRRVDPGMRAHRDVDTMVARGLDAQDISSPDGSRRFTAPPRTTRDAAIQSEAYRTRVRQARRLDFFDRIYTKTVSKGPEGSIDRSKRMGFRYYEEFTGACGGQALESRRLSDIRDQLVDGLHVVQGIRPKSRLHLFLADPAFLRGTSHAPIIARRILRSAIRVGGLSSTWTQPKVPLAVDWLERAVVMSFASDDETILLDLVRFEIVMRAGAGVAFREFHAPEIRALLRSLSRLAAAQADSAILVMEGPVLRAVSIDGPDFVVGDP